MSNIKEIKSRQIFDSRGNPTVEADVITVNGNKGSAAVPSGASTGKYEAVELRDGDESKYLGKSVFNAVNNINNLISKKLVGVSVFDQVLIDNLMIELDGTENKSNIGANAILAVSLAVSKAAASERGISLFNYLGEKNNPCILPVPQINILNAGSHSDSPIAFQEFMIVPVGAKSFSNALQIANEVFHNLKKNLKSMNLSTSVGDEGGFAPKLNGTEDALNIIIDSVNDAGYKANDDIMIALDCAASEFYSNGVYDYSIFEGNNARKLNSDEQVEYLISLCEKFPIISIEDGMDEDDWDGWKKLTEKIGNKVQLVGDDLFVTNPKRLKKGIKKSCANSMLVKVNQIGTLTETLEAVDLAHRANYTNVMSHRSGETEDTTIADLAVSTNCGQIKTGSLARSDRLAKYNQLIRIEEELGGFAKYAGRSILK